MREVTFKTYLTGLKAGQGHWVHGRGFFHVWGATYEAFENGGTQVTIALVEAIGGDGVQPGKVYQCNPTDIAFLTQPNPTT